MAKESFYDAISSNKRNSVFLILLIFAVFFGLAWAISMAFQPGYFFVIMSLSIFISIIYILGTYYNCDKIALWSVSAKPADARFKHQQNMVEGLAIAAGIPAPRLFIMQNEQINAFASGRDPKHAVICLTTAACEKLKDTELEGVIAHEMAHIKNFDVRFMTLVAVMVGAIAIFSEMFLRSLWYGGGSRDSDNGKGNAIFFLIAILLAIIAPLIVKIVQLSISRKREYLADSSSVQFTRYPVGLISALKKINAVNKPVKVTSAMQPLFFAETWPEKTQSMFSTHPPISARIRALKEIGG